MMMNHEGRVTRQPPYSVVYEASTKQMPSSFYLHILFIIAITRMMIMMNNDEIAGVGEDGNYELT